MPDRIAPFIDLFFISIYTFTMFIASFNFLTVFGGIIYCLVMATRLKKEIEKNHNGEFFKWLKWLVKKN